MKPKINSDLNSINMHFWSNFSDSSLNGWQVIMQTNSKWEKLKVKVDQPQNNRDLDRTKIHFWSKYDDSS